MSRLLFGSLLPVLWIVLAAPATADDGTRAVIDKAIKAHGGEKKLSQHQAMRSKSKGKIELPGAGSLDFTQETAFKSGGKFKEVVQLEIGGQQVTVTTVYNGKKAWINANGTTQELNDQILDEVQQAAWLARLSRLITLKDKGLTIQPLGEVKVNGKPAVGVKVSSKGHRDVSLYFDKDSGLVVKVERRAKDLQSGKELIEERLVTEYQDVDGQKVAKKVSVKRDGKKYLDAEVTEFNFDTIDDSEFAEP